MAGGVWPVTACEISTEVTEKQKGEEESREVCLVHVRTEGGLPNFDLHFI